jgi:GntR family transcriptional regulator
MARTIDFDGGMHLWRQLAEIIREQIESGDLAPQAYLPSKQDLARQFGVSLRTVDTATGFLRDEGYIRTVIGRGFWILPPEERGHRHPRRRSTDR